MPATRRYAPVWLWGATMSPFGFYGGIIAIAIPQLLAARHVPEGQIAALTGLLFLPGATNFLLAPVLDVRFSRRAYAFALAIVGALCLFSALMLQQNLVAFESLIIAGFVAINLYAAALGGWTAGIVPTHKIPLLSVWSNIANIAAGGLMAFLVMLVLRNLPLAVAAGLLSSCILFPTIVFFFMPSPGPDRRLAGESFAGLLRAIVGLVRRREVLLVLMLFLLPSSSFALTNILGGVGADFRTSERLVSLLGGLGVTLAGGLACVVSGPLCARLPLRRLYLSTGIVGGLFTLSLLALPRGPLAFGVAMLGENAFQSIAFTVMTAIALRTVGHNNALASTEYSILISAGNIPIVYMQFLDGQGYAAGHLAGALATDAGISIVVCLALLGVLAALRNSPSWRAATPHSDTGTI